VTTRAGCGANKPEMQPRIDRKNLDPGSFTLPRRFDMRAALLPRRLRRRNRYILAASRLAADPNA
jgi:hypothetical protein